MSSGSSSRSGAKPIAPLPPAPNALRPSTKGSSMTPRNWLVSWNATCCAPVAASPESSVSALPRLTPVSPKRFANVGGSVPPLLKKALIALATLHWLMLKAQALAAFGPLSGVSAPSAAVRLRFTSVAVQRRGEVGGQVGGGQRVERADASARGR